MLVLEIFVGLILIAELACLVAYTAAVIIVTVLLVIQTIAFLWRRYRTRFLHPITSGSGSRRTTDPAGRKLEGIPWISLWG